jgi:dTDP-4-amino-4,6-dideoxygalactose transaminase
VGTVAKRASDPNAFVRGAEYFPNARTALRTVLSRMGVPAEGAVLLPAYVGWSPRENSGVFDPILALGASYRFYRMTSELHIDLEDLRRTLLACRARVFVLIHYFGYPDPQAARAAALARNAGALVVEDEAHALFSDLVGGVCGRWGDAAIFSLHKMLPVDSGGLLLANDPRWYRTPVPARDGAAVTRPLVDFDLARIAQVRRKNARFLARRLKSLPDSLVSLRPELPAGVVPQSFPVVLKQAPRDVIYAKMNEAGFGAVSLYHTLIEAINGDAFPDSHWLSRRILNLPVHQDATESELDAMVSHLAGLLRTCPR